MSSRSTSLYRVSRLGLYVNINRILKDKVIQLHEQDNTLPISVVCRYGKGKRAKKVAQSDLNVNIKNHRQVFFFLFFVEASKLVDADRKAVATRGRRADGSTANVVARNDGRSATKTTSTLFFHKQRYLSIVYSLLYTVVKCGFFFGARKEYNQLKLKGKPVNCAQVIVVVYCVFCFIRKHVHLTLLAAAFLTWLHVSSKTVLFHFCFCLLLLLVSCGYQSGVCFSTNLFPLPQSMTDPSLFSRFRLLYGPFSSSSPQLDVTYYLRQSCANYSSQTSIKVCNLFVI